MMGTSLFEGRDPGRVLGQKEREPNIESLIREYFVETQINK
jgi:hypothetical protein